MKNFIPCLTILLLLSSCNSYYKVITVKNPDAAEITRTINKENKFFILRTDSTAFAMNNIVLNNDSKEIKCFLTDLPDKHKLHLPGRENKKLKYSKAANENNQTAVLTEVHLFTASGDFYNNGQYSIPLNKVIKTDIIEKDKRRTGNSHAIGIVIGTVTTIVVAGAIFASSFQIKL